MAVFRSVQRDFLGGSVAFQKGQHCFCYAFLEQTFTQVATTSCEWVFVCFVLSSTNLEQKNSWN